MMGSVSRNAVSIPVEPMGFVSSLMALPAASAKKATRERAATRARRVFARQRTERVSRLAPLDCLHVTRTRSAQTNPVLLRAFVLMATKTMTLTVSVLSRVLCWRSIVAVTSTVQM